MTRHIQAYFNEEDDALSAAVSLRALGANEVSTDRSAERGASATLLPGAVSRSGMIAAMNPTQASTIALGLTPDGATLFKDDADEMAEGSGQAMLTAVVSEEIYEQAVAIVEEQGGRVD